MTSQRREGFEMELELNKKAPVRERTGARKPDNQIRSGFGPSFHGGPKTESEWQVSWLQGHLTSRAFPENSSGIVRCSSPVTVAGQRRIQTFFPFTRAAKHGTKTVWLNNCADVCSREGRPMSKEITAPSAPYHHASTQLPVFQNFVRAFLQGSGFSPDSLIQAGL